MSSKAFLFLSLLVFLALCSASWAIDDMVAHWKFDEGQGTTAYDSVGDNHGAIHDAYWSMGQIAGALEFDGQQAYVDLGDDDSIKPPLPLTISAWIMLCNGEGYRRIVGLGNQNPDYYGVMFRVIDRKLYTTYGDGGHPSSVNRRSKHGEVELDENTWYQVVAVVNGPGDIKMYINGVEDIGHYDGTGGPLRYAAGSSFIGCDSQSVAYFSGKIDDVRIFDHGLTVEQVDQLYSGGLPAPVEVAVDIKPGSCPNPVNVSSRGLLPVAILGSDELDVNDIDLASIRLAGVAPVRSGYEDVATPAVDTNECVCSEEGPDGHIDLTLKFKTQEIIAELVEAYGDLNAGDTWELFLTGMLTDETPIEGADCIVIRGKVPASLKAKKSDINDDGMVNMLDFVVMSGNWLEPAVQD